MRDLLSAETEENRLETKIKKRGESTVSDVFLKMAGIQKSFPGVHALTTFI